MSIRKYRQLPKTKQNKSIVYVDVGTLNGYREAMRLLGGYAAPAGTASPGVTRRFGASITEDTA